MSRVANFITLISCKPLSVIIKVQYGTGGSSNFMGKLRFWHHYPQIIINNPSLYMDIISILSSLPSVLFCSCGWLSLTCMPWHQILLLCLMNFFFVSRFYTVKFLPGFKNSNTYVELSGMLGHFQLTFKLDIWHESRRNTSKPISASTSTEKRNM